MSHYEGVRDFVKMLKNLDAWLVKGTAHAQKKSFDPNVLASQRVRIALQGHAPFAAATQAVYVTLKALRDGELPKNLKDVASSELTGRVTRDADMKTRSSEFLGLKR